MFEIRITDVFDRWLENLNDRRARSIILNRIDRITAGNLGDAKSVGGRVFELSIFHGSGYRLYFSRKGSELIVLLCGGDKSTQRKDIERAKRLQKDV